MVSKPQGHISHIGEMFGCLEALGHIVHFLCFKRSHLHLKARSYEAHSVYYIPLSTLYCNE